MTVNPSPEPTILESPEEVLTTLRKDGRRRWMYPTLSKGIYWKWRAVVGWALIVLFMALPVVHIGGKPAVLLDVMHREFTFFGLTLYATDTVLLMLGMISVFLGVIFATALMGRVWCGWGCPQTVYMEYVFRPIEALFEGNANKRRRQDDRELTFALAARKGAKWLVFSLISLVLAHTFVAYFVGWESLIAWMTGPPAEHWGFFVMMALTTGLMLFNFGWFREQMCTIACPYARLQSVLMDRDSLIVSYDEGRGEPRGRRSKAQAATLALGDCVDCGACVRTCPTGIDIRQGLQMECVSCTQCIDACDAIMVKTGQPVGLIRYTSLNALENTRPRIVRPRMAGYTVALVVMVSLFTVALLGRESVDINLSRVPGAPFVEMPSGEIANRVRFRVHNRTGADDTFRIAVTEPQGARVNVVGNPALELSDGQMTHIDAWVVIPKGAFGGNKATEGAFKVSADGGDHKSANFTLLGPTPKTR